MTSRLEPESPGKPGVTPLPVDTSARRPFKARWFIDAIGVLVLWLLGGEFVYQLTKSEVGSPIFLLSFLPSIAFLVLRHLVKLPPNGKRLGWWAGLGLAFVASCVAFYAIAALIHH